MNVQVALVPASNLLDLWPAVVLIVGPVLVGWLGGLLVDAWLVLRDLRAGRPVDRCADTPDPLSPPPTTGGV